MVSETIVLTIRRSGNNLDRALGIEPSTAEFKGPPVRQYRPNSIETRESSLGDREERPLCCAQTHSNQSVVRESNPSELIWKTSASAARPTTHLSCRRESNSVLP